MAAGRLQGNTKNGVGDTNSSTLGVIGVGSPEAARGRADRPTGPQKFLPNFSKMLRARSKFSCALYGDLQGPSVIKFLATVPWPISAEKNPKFRRKSMISRVTRISLVGKKVVAMRGYAI